MNKTKSVFAVITITIFLIITTIVSCGNNESDKYKYLIRYKEPNGNVVAVVAYYNACRTTNGYIEYTTDDGIKYYIWSDYITMEVAK